MTSSDFSSHSFPASYNHIYGYPTLNFKKYLVGIIYNQKKAKKKDNVACAMYGVDVIVVCDVFTITPCWILLYSKKCLVHKVLDDAQYTKTIA